jgi:hypothetical protein
MVLSASAFVASSLAAQAQVVGNNVVGYINLQISTGDNLIANQLGASPDNTLDNVLYQGVLAGSTFSEWDPVHNQLLPASIYDGSTWSINYIFGPDGTGGVLNSPTTTIVTTVGDVVNFQVDGPLGYTFVPPNRGPGTYLLALAAPVQEISTFQNIVGRAPFAGESVITLDGPSQMYATNSFNGTSWSDGDPILAVGKSAYFDLEAVPEPSTVALCGLGVGTMWILRRRKMAS